MRKALQGEEAVLARTLARAFQDDPVLSWLIPDGARRAVSSERSFALYLRRIWLRHGETYVGGEAAGVCVWGPPGSRAMGVGERLGMLPAMARAYGRLLPRLLGAIATMERRHPTEPHFYLPFLGVLPESQGRGLGSRMMFPVLSRCDAEGVPAYLEASTPRNWALYERHGFEVVGELELGRGAPPMWPMWRAADRP